MGRLPRWLEKPLFYLALGVYAWLLVLPLLTLLSASFRSDADLYAPGLLPPRPTLEAYQEAIQKYPVGHPNSEKPPATFPQAAPTGDAKRGCAPSA